MLFENFGFFNSLITLTVCTIQIHFAIDFLLLCYFHVLLGTDQVAVGLAPIGFANKSSESALSIYPIAIGNCKEKWSVIDLI